LKVRRNTSQKAQPAYRISLQKVRRRHRLSRPLLPISFSITTTNMSSPADSKTKDVLKQEGKSFHFIILVLSWGVVVIIIPA
jgi:hypothetical protein